MVPRSVRRPTKLAYLHRPRVLETLSNRSLCHMLFHTRDIESPGHEFAVFALCRQAQVFLYSGAPNSPLWAPTILGLILRMFPQHLNLHMLLCPSRIRSFQ